jgi:hypothetical protein
MCCVCLVQINPESLGDATQIKSFEQEAVTLARLRPHQNVVLLYGVCQSPLSIITEFAGT